MIAHTKIGRRLHTDFAHSADTMFHLGGFWGRQCLALAFCLLSLLPAAAQSPETLFREREARSAGAVRTLEPHRQGKAIRAARTSAQAKAGLSRVRRVAAPARPTPSRSVTEEDRSVDAAQVGERKLLEQLEPAARSGLVEGLTERLEDARGAEERARVEAEAKRVADQRAEEKARADAETRRIADAKATEERARADAEAKRVAEAKAVEERARADDEAKQRSAQAEAAEVEARARAEVRKAEERARADVEAKRIADAILAAEQAERKRVEDVKAAEEKARSDAEAKRVADARAAEEATKAAAEKLRLARERLAVLSAQRECLLAMRDRSDDGTIAKCLPLAIAPENLSLFGDVSAQVGAFNRVGLAFSKRGDFENAYKYFDIAVGLDTNSIVALVGRGNSQLQRSVPLKDLSKVRLSISDFKAAVKLDSLNCSAHFGEGVAFRVLDEATLALSEFRAAEAACTDNLRVLASSHVKQLTGVANSNEPGLTSVRKADDVLGQRDLSNMHQTYEANQARFMRDFKGKSFSARISLHNVTENPFLRGSYMVGFGENGFFADVSCEVTDRRLVAMVTDLNKGDYVEVSGNIRDHVMGSVILESCRIFR